MDERVKDRVEEVKNSEACEALCGEGRLTRLGQGKTLSGKRFKAEGGWRGCGVREIDIDLHRRPDYIDPMIQTRRSILKPQ